MSEKRKLEEKVVALQTALLEERKVSGAEKREVRQRYCYLYQYFHVFLVVCVLSHLLFFGLTALLFALFLVPSPSNRSRQMAAPPRS